MKFIIKFLRNQLYDIFPDDETVCFLRETNNCRFIDYYNFTKLDKPKTRLEGYTMKWPDGTVVRMWKYKDKGLMVVKGRKELKDLMADPDFDLITR